MSARGICFSLLALSATCYAAPSQQDKRWGGWWQPTGKGSFDFSKRFSFDTFDCDVSRATLPQLESNPLPPPAAGLSLYQVSVGRGTQNYTCATSDASSVPVAVGAVATLYNATCLAASAPALLETLPAIALDLPEQSASSLDMDIAGHHYFIDLTTPFFNFDTAAHQWGIGPFSKVNAASAPSSAVVGQFGQGYGAVAWLQLDTKDGASETLQQVYRVNTAGGQPPATCEGQPAAFEVQYAAEYWTYSGTRS